MGQNWLIFEGLGPGRFWFRLTRMTKIGLRVSSFGQVLVKNGQFWSFLVLVKKGSKLTIFGQDLIKIGYPKANFGDLGWVARQFLPPLDRSGPEMA